MKYVVTEIDPENTVIEDSFEDVDSAIEYMWERMELAPTHSFDISER